MSGPTDLFAPAWTTVGYNTPGNAAVPMFRAHAWALEAAHHAGCRFVVTSADRRKGVAEKYGHKSQAQLYADYLAGHGYRANPPGFSSHELRSDGNGVYRTARGKALPDYMLGVDAVDDGSTNDCAHLVAILNRLGIVAVRPYHSGAEAHHFVVIRPFGTRAWMALIGQVARNHSRRWYATLMRHGVS